MTRRNHNIEIVRQLILAGYSYRDIWRKSNRYFTSKKFDEYYEIASDEINNPTETFTEYVKQQKKREKEDKTHG